MSQSSPEPNPGVTSGGGILTRKFAGIPAWVILGAAGLLAYWYFSHQSSTAAQTQGLKTTGGGGSAKTGKVVVQKGAVSINVRQTPNGDEDNPQPGNHPPPRHKQQSVPKDLHAVTVNQAKEYREEVRDPEIYVKPKGGKTQEIPEGGDIQYQATRGQLYVSDSVFNQYIKGKQIP